MIYFKTEETGIVESHGPDEYPGCYSVPESDMPESWMEYFVQSKLGYKDGKFFTLGPLTNPPSTEIFDIAGTDNG